MFSVVEVDPNSEGKVHSHPEEQWGFLLKGEGTRIQDGREIKVGVGDFWQTKGGVKHGFVAGNNGAVVLDVFSPIRKDYLAHNS